MNGIILGNAGSDGSGAISVPDAYFFPDEGTRDAYFADPQHVAELQTGMYVVTDGVLQRYDGDFWIDMSAVVRGPKGNKGDTGNPGESAYQEWLDAGNTGSEADFLASLKGEDGDKGDKGDRGDPGAPGNSFVSGLKAAGVSYAVGETVFYLGSFYRCKTAATVPDTDIPDWLQANFNVFSAVDQAARDAAAAAGSAAGAAQSDIDTHAGRTDNPHGVTKTQVGLSNVTDDAQVKAADANGDFTTDVDFSIDGDTVIAEQFYKNPVTGQTKQIDKNIPLADQTHAGLMAKEDVEAIVDLKTRVSSLEGKSTRYSVTIPANPSQADLTALYQSASGKTGNPPDATQLVDTAQNILYSYFETDETWHGPESDTVSAFTNSSPGVIKGTATAGRVYAENDGTGSVYGWDEEVTRTANLESWKTTHDGDNTRHITSEERTAWNGKVSPEAGKGLSTNDFDNASKAKLDFIGSQTVTSPASIAVTKQIVTATVSTNQALSIASVSVENAAFVIVIKATADITVALPDGVGYRNMYGPSLAVASGGVAIVHLFYNSADSLYYLNVEETTV
jgi:hypothetical protein